MSRAKPLKRLHIVLAALLLFVGCDSSTRTGAGPPGIQPGTKFSAKMIDFSLDGVEAKEVHGDYVRVDSQTGLGTPVEWINFKNVIYYNIEK